MTLEEVNAITVSYADAPKRLPTVMETYGVALITGCVDADDLNRLENLFREDLEQLLAAPSKEAGASPSDMLVQCEGRTQKGERCTVTSMHTGIMAKFSRPLKNGSRFCSRHAPAIDPSIPQSDALKPFTGIPLKLSDWPLSSLHELGEGERCSQRGLPHGKFAWACRRLQAVQQCYKILHGIEDLVTGLDNSFFVPESAPRQKTNREWPHVDQNFNCKEDLKHWDCYQSVLYIWPSTAEKASTTVVWPKSHSQVHAEMMSDSNCPCDTHFVQIARLSEALQKKLLPIWRSEARRVPVPAGGLLLWNSRTVHQGWSGGPRLAHPICWEPRSRRDEAALERKMRLCALGLPSTHWASLGLPHSMLAGVHLPLQRNITIGVHRATLRSTLEGKPRSDDTSAKKAWEQFAEPEWTAPLQRSLRRALETSLCDDILALL